MTTARLVPMLENLPIYRAGRSDPGAVKLSSNELSAPMPAAVQRAITEYVQAGSDSANRYPDPAAVALTGALAELAGVDPERVVPGAGSVALCQLLAQVTTLPGEEILYGWRSFEAYPLIARLGSAVPVQVPLTAGYALDLPAMAAAVTERTRLIFLCTPNNPTGTTSPAAAVEEFLDQVPGDVLVVIDEAYREFDRAPDSPDGVEIASRRSNVLALRTLSKAYALAGLRVGYAVGDPAVITALRQVTLPFAVNAVAQVSAVAALADRESVRPLWDQVVRERARVTAELRAAGFEVPDSQANFVWLPLGEAAGRFADHCAAHGVLVRAFATADGGVRVSIGTPAENDRFLTAATTYR